MLFYSVRLLPVTDLENYLGRWHRDRTNGGVALAYLVHIKFVTLLLFNSHYLWSMSLSFHSLISIQSAAAYYCLSLDVGPFPAVRVQITHFGVFVIPSRGVIPLAAQSCGGGHMPL